MMLGMRIKYTGGVELVKPTAKGDKKIVWLVHIGCHTQVDNR